MQTSLSFSMTHVGLKLLNGKSAGVYRERSDHSSIDAMQAEGLATAQENKWIIDSMNNV